MRKTAFRIILAAGILFCAFAAYSHFTPDMQIAVGHPVDANAESYVQQVTVGVSTKLGLPLPRKTKERLAEFAQANEAAVLELRQAYEKPMRVTAAVEVVGGQTIVTYTGTAVAPESGGIKIKERRLVFDFVLTRKIS